MSETTPQELRKFMDWVAFVMKGDPEQLGRYGENWHQKAWKVTDIEFKGPSILTAEQVHGGPCGYNNYLDAQRALNAALDIMANPGVVVVKHGNPCGMATSLDGEEGIVDLSVGQKRYDAMGQAFLRAWQGDVVSAFGSVIALTRPFDDDIANLVNNRFVEVVIAPDYVGSAVDKIKANPNKEGLRLLQVDSMTEPRGPGYVLRHVDGGMLIQERDDKLTLAPSIDDLLLRATEMHCDNSGKDLMVGVVSERMPETASAGLYEFGIYAAKATGSNAVMIVREYAPGKYQVLGMGAGQPNRMDAAKKLAAPKAEENLQREYFKLHGREWMESQPVLEEAGIPKNWEKAMKRFGPQESRLGMQSKMLEYRKMEESYVQEQLASENTLATSDAYFPKADGVQGLLDMGVRNIVSPGGSKGDAEVIDCVDKHDAILVHTGVRKFVH